MAPQQPPAGSPLPPPPGAPAAYDAGYGYGQQPYHPYGQQVVMATNPFDEKATTILVLGILGLVVCQLLGVAAWVMGNNLKKEAESAGYPEPEKGKIGRILGMISAGLLALGLVFMVFWFVFVVILAGTSST